MYKKPTTWFLLLCKKERKNTSFWALEDDLMTSSRTLLNYPKIPKMMEWWRSSWVARRGRMFTNSTDASGISLENPGSPLCQKKLVHRKLDQQILLFRECQTPEEIISVGRAVWSGHRNSSVLHLHIMRICIYTLGSKCGSKGRQLEKHC